MQRKIKIYASNKKSKAPSEKEVNASFGDSTMGSLVD